MNPIPRTHLRIDFILILCLLTFQPFTFALLHASDESQGTFKSASATTSREKKNEPIVPNANLLAALAEPTTEHAFGRNSAPVLASLAYLNRQHAKSVVQIHNKDGLCCLGTLISADGLLLTKHSAAVGALTCIAHDQTRQTGTVIAVDPRLDLALIQLTESNPSFSHPVPLTRADSHSQVTGSVVVSISEKTNPAGMGLITTSTRLFPVKQPKCRDCVDLGSTFARWPVTQTIPRIAVGSDTPLTETVTGLSVERVYPRTVAERIGLLTNDVLLTLNGQAMTDHASLRRVASVLRIGQQVNAAVIRNGQRESLSATIKQFSSRVFHDRWGGGPFSKRRFEFGDVIAHDTPLKPQQCGGPLVDLNGQVIGINIARSFRVASFSIPLEKVRQFVSLVRPELIK